MEYIEYNFGQRYCGKSYSAMIQLCEKLIKGVRCSVACYNPEKVKRDFLYMTGKELELIPNGVATEMYAAKLK